jgi:antirestriction protein ArdC
MSYRQAQELGGQVRRGERGSQVVYMGETTKTCRDEGTGEEMEQGAQSLVAKLGLREITGRRRSRAWDVL